MPVGSIGSTPVRDETIEDIMMRIQKLMLENELLRTAIEQQDKDNQILRERLTMLQGANTISKPDNADAVQALQDVTDAVAEMEAMLIEQRNEIKRLREEGKPQ